MAVYVFSCHLRRLSVPQLCQLRRVSDLCWLAEFDSGDSVHRPVERAGNRLDSVVAAIWELAGGEACEGVGLGDVAVRLQRLAVEVGRPVEHADVRGAVP